MEKIEIKDLEYNLYELLGIEIGAPIKTVKTAFRSIVKKFHPDKISKLEENIYYNITMANHILSNEQSKNRYDNWLLKSNKSHDDLKKNFKSDDIKQYFPKSSREAQVKFKNDSDCLLKRHGMVNEDTRNITVRYKEKDSQRREMKAVTREDFNDMDEFNNRFIERKQDGSYSDKIIKYDNANIVPYEKSRNNISYVELKNFNKLYVEDTVQTSSFTSLNRAFTLQPVMKNPKSSDINYEINEYNNLTDDIANNANKCNLGNLDF